MLTVLTGESHNQQLKCRFLEAVRGEWITQELVHNPQSEDLPFNTAMTKTNLPQCDLLFPKRKTCRELWSADGNSCGQGNTVKEQISVTKGSKSKRQELRVYVQLSLKLSTLIHI